MTRSSVSDEQIGRLHRRTDDMIRRVIEGTISFESTMDVMQAIIEGKHEPAPKSAVSRMKVCAVFSGNRCTICGSYFADGDSICGCGHEIGASYF